MCTMILLGLSMYMAKVKAQTASQIIMSPLSLPEQTIGQTFTLTVNLTNFPDLACYQVVLIYNGSVLNMTGVTFPSDYVFSSETLVQTLYPPTETEAAGDAKTGLNWTMAGATLIGAGSVAVSNGILLEENFTVIGTGDTTITLGTYDAPIYVRAGPLFTTFYSLVLDVNFNEYHDFVTQGLTILCGVANAPPVPYFTISATPPPGGNRTNLLLYANPPQNVEGGLICWEGEPVVFNASLSYAPTGNITAYAWAFGDSNVTFVVNATSPDAWLITHVYTTVGAIYANLTVFSSQPGNSSKLNSQTYTQLMLIGWAIPYYNWTPFLDTIFVLIVLAIVLAAANSTVKRVRRRRRLRQARLAIKPTGQGSTAAKTM